VAPEHKPPARKRRITYFERSEVEEAGKGKVHIKAIKIDLVQTLECLP
jgi:hypothetical protein